MSAKLSPYPLYAFYTLHTKLNPHLTLPQISLDTFKKHLNQPLQPDPPSALFVTWKINNPGAGKVDSLRGCIGNFSPMELNGGIKDYALISALEDYRFNPITIDEMPFLSVSVTLLQDFEKVQDPLDWEIGKHGTKIEFRMNGRRYDATFLPEIPVEERWSKEQTLRELIIKSGCRQSNSVGINDVQLTRYQGRKSEVSYEEYLKFYKEIAGKSMS